MGVIPCVYGTGVYVDGKIFGWVCDTLNDKYSTWSVDQTKDKKLFDTKEEGVQYLFQLDQPKQINSYLMEALEMMLVLSGGVEVGDVVYNKAVKALNKAKGE